MEYNIKLINVYTSLRHSELLDNDTDSNSRLSKESILQFQNLLNRSLPSTPTERLVFQTHRQLLKVSLSESVAIITKTKLWHLCLCSSIPVLRAILKVPENVVVTYEKSTGYCVTTHLDKINEDFPVLTEPASTTTNKKTEYTQPLPKGDWVNVTKKYNNRDIDVTPGQQGKYSYRQRADSERSIRVLKRGESINTTRRVSSPTPTSNTNSTQNGNSSESLENAIRKLKDMPSQNWADANDDQLNDSL